jgi:HEPN domain-containing protein
MKEHEKWFRKAENDLLSITNNLASTNIPIDVCCFHAQQASEKYLKAYLVSKNASFPKTHDLQSLILLCSSINPLFKEILDTGLKLSDFSVAIRYPDEFDDLTLLDAKNALDNALIIKNFVLHNFMK